MRYKTFRSLMIVGGVAVVGALGYWGVRSCTPRGEQPLEAFRHLLDSPTKPTPTTPTTKSADATPSAALGPGVMPLRDMDRAVLELAKTPLGGDKKKDALPGRPYKVNLYQDKGSSTPNRAKVDLNRNDKWDEKWTFEPDGKVTRQVAPADDERYTEEWQLAGERWVNPARQAASQPAEKEPAPAAGEGAALRPFDNEVVALGERTLPGDKAKDALPGRPFKVNLYQDAGKKKVNRLKLDLNRNDKWDEKWTFEEEGGRVEVKRQVAPADDEQYTEEYRLRAGKWVRKK